MRNRFVCRGHTYTSDEIKAGNIYLPTSLPGTSLEVATFEVDVESSDVSLREFQQNDLLEYIHAGRTASVFNVQHVERIGEKLYHISAVSPVGRLDQWNHMGVLLNGGTLEEVVRDICGPVQHIVKENLRGIKLYGWLPIAKARDNLSQVLFAVGAASKIDLDGILRIEPLWDGYSGAVIEDKMYEDGSVEYASPVSAVAVTEHQYMEGGEETKLFEGITHDGDIITFSEPMYALAATGFTILSSNANYAKVGAGTGVLTGRKYIHNTRQVTRSVGKARSGAAENVRTVTDATLVSVVNSVAVAERLANYYQCAETISNDIVLDRQSPGDVVSAYHTYDKETVSACIESLDINVSGTLKASAKALVGFSPIPFEDVQYFDHREVITADTDWVVPEGVTTVSATLGGGGDGGWSGCYGQETKRPPTGFSDSVNGNPRYGLYATAGALGGEGGGVGQGGKVLDITVLVTPGQVIPARIGKGGAGGVASVEGSAPGSPGGNTTFGEYSSADGVSSPSGYYDTITKETYSTPSTKPGIAGGKGSGAETENLTDGYTIGPSITDYSGNVWNAGPITDAGENDVYYLSSGNDAESGKGLGGGAAVGSHGSAGFTGAVGYEADTRTLYAASGTSGKGADAVQPPKSTILGGGGDGGHGGGGEGGKGICAVTTSKYNHRLPVGDYGGPGAGSPGGDGGDGYIILRYRRIKGAVSSGAFLTQDGRFFLDGLGRFFVG